MFQSLFGKTDRTIPLRVKMKMLILFAVLVSVFALTTAKPVKEEDRLLAKREEKSDPEDVLVTESSTTESSGTESSGTEDEAEEDGSTIDEEPRSREKRNAYEDLEDEEKTKDSSGADSKEENGDDNEETNDDTSGDDRLQEHKLQWKNTLGIRGPFTITAYQPPESEISSKKGKKKNNQFSMDFVSPSGNIEITPFAPAINSLKKVRRRCLCPLPCGAEYELIGCSGPYTVPCGGGFGGLWPGLGCGGCGGCGGYGGLYGLGGCGGFGGGYPWYGGGLGLGGCGGCGGYGGCGCGGCGGGCCGGGCCGFPMMCCCCKDNGKDNKPEPPANDKENDFSRPKPSASKAANIQRIKPLPLQPPLKVNKPLVKVPKL